MNDSSNAPSKFKRTLYFTLFTVGWVFTIFGSVIAVTMLLIDLFSSLNNPYLSIITYMIAPAIMFIGLIFLVNAKVVKRKHLRKHASSGSTTWPVLNLNKKRHFIYFISFMTGGSLLVVFSTVGAYRGYHFTESTEFCGTVCHEVMKPEYTAYQNSPHANVHCTECHIGPGADFFVKSKINGLYQVYSVLNDKFSRPIPAPVHNLRPAKETCYTCHWPKKFFGAVELSRTFFLADEENTPWSIRMLVKVGGGDPEHGRAEGIHWHVASGNKIEYIASDEKRQQIPWVRMTDKDGNVTVYETNDDDLKLTDELMAQSEIRTMDCIDCHNRPSHQYHAPDRALNEAMSVGLIDASIPYIKKHAAEALIEDYETETEALASIHAYLTSKYPDSDPRIDAAVKRVQTIYQNNFFPEMKVNWKAYPDNIGHHYSPGCYRCHDGLHENSAGDIIGNDCKSCHTIIAQGPGLNPVNISSNGLDFKHPEDIDEEWKETPCSDCHDGVPDL